MHTALAASDILLMVCCFLLNESIRVRPLQTRSGTLRGMFAKLTNTLFAIVTAHVRRIVCICR
jgi:hypothetical protein